jgi:hypothetical protein
MKNPGKATNVPVTDEYVIDEIVLLTANEDHVFP